MAGEEQNTSALLSEPRQRTQDNLHPFGYDAPGQSDFPTYTDRLEEIAAEDQKILQEEISARKDQIYRVQRSLEIGDLVAPTSDSFGGFKAIHDYRMTGSTGGFPVQFNAFQFEIFDGKIASAMDGDEKTSGPMHRGTEENKDLRRNIAILRNILYVQCFGRDGYQSFVPSDAANKDKIEKMAEMLGDALAKGKNGKAPFFNSLSVEEASVPDKGVIAMYNYLCTVEKQPWHRPFWKAIKSIFSSDLAASYDWKMRPIEQTPLAPVYMKMDEMGIEPYIKYTEQTPGAKKANLGVQMDYARAQLTVPEMLDKPVQDKAIYLAMKILQNWKITAGTNPQNANLAVNEADELQQMERIYEASIVYKDKYSQLLLANPALKDNPAFASANDAMAKLTYMMKQQALEDFTLEGNQNSAQIMAELRDRIPRSHRPQPGETFDILVERLEQGLAETARMRGLPGPWMGMSQQAALSNAQSLAQQTQVLNQKGHEDVNAALRNRPVGISEKDAAKWDAEYSARMNALGIPQHEASNIGSELRNKISEATIQSTSHPAANELVQQTAEQKAASQQHAQQQAMALAQGK